MNTHPRISALVIGLALASACTEDDTSAAAGADETPAGDAGTTTPCSDVPVDTEAVPAATIARFEAAQATHFNATGAWTESTSGAARWSHPVVGTPATLTVTVEPAPDNSWTRFATNSEDCTARLGQKVTVTARTSDGALSEHFDARLIDGAGETLNLTGQVDWSSLVGSLRNASVEPAGAIRVLSRFDLKLSGTSLAGTLTGLAEYSEEEGQVVRVNTFSMANW